MKPVTYPRDWTLFNEWTLFNCEISGVNVVKAPQTTTGLYLLIVLSLLLLFLMDLVVHKCEMEVMNYRPTFHTINWTNLSI